jgi:dienelactone hydrolase
LRHENVINDVDDNLTCDDNIAMKINYLAIWIISLCLSACSYTSPITRQFDADQLAISKEWQREELNTTPFKLVSYLPTKITSNDVLTVYIEGDGFAWQNSRRPSSDPTPHNPVALKLALKHPNDAAAYLARPCQYHADRDKTALCHKIYWTNKRYAPEVIKASEQALTQLKERFNASKLILVGYSGGGAVAALLATQRDDVVKLITVAGNLNHQAWTELHNLSPLTGSLSPTDYLDKLQTIPQIHFVGEDDKNIPPKLSQEFIATYDSAELANVIMVPEQSHSCCWQEVWPGLISNTQN